MTTDRSSRPGRVLGRISKTFDELEEAQQRRLQARIELLAPVRPDAWRGGQRVVDESSAEYERRAWDEFTC